MKNYLLILALLVFPFIAQAGTYEVKTFEMNFLMDAPIEKIKGELKKGAGKIEVNESDLSSVKGSILINLADISLHTFGDAEKDKTQTDHMKNWFEIGGEVSPETRKKFQNAELKITGVTKQDKISDLETRMIVTGDLTLHGITKSKSIELSIVKADGGFEVKTTKPFMVNLAEHDVRPRDIAGKLVQKTLESLGQKVARDAQVNIQLTLKK